MAITKLSVINAMLSSIGMSPLSASDTQHPSYIQANAKIDEIDAAFQNRGWWFNRTTKVLKKNGEGEIPIPTNAVHVDPIDRSKVYVMRNLLMYNLTDGTFNIGADTECKVVYQLPFPDLPPLAQAYLKDKARHDFYLDQDGSEPKLTRYARIAEISYVSLRVEHLKNSDVNFFDGKQNQWFRNRFHPVTR